MKFTLFDLRSIKTRVTFSTLVIFVFSLWALSFFTSHMLQNDMQRMLGEQQFSTVSFIAAEVNDELHDRVAALELIAREIDPHLMSDPSALQARLEQRPILSMLFNGGVIVTGADGVAIADVPLSIGRIGVNYLERENIAIALKEGKTLIGRPVMGKKLGAPIFSIAAPIRDAQGKVIGTLVGTINLGKPNFLDKITQSGYGKSGGYVLITPPHRLVVTATDQSRIMETLPAPGINVWVDRFVQGYEGSAVAINPHGVEVLVSGKRIPVAGWHVLAVLPTAEAFAPMVAIQQRFLLSVSFFTVFASAVTWWLLTWTMRRQLAPMLATVKMLDTLAESNRPPQPLPNTRQDEIGKLIDSFNRLLEILDKRNEELRESHILLEQTFEQSPVPMVLVSMPNALLRIVNPALREQLGLLDEPSPVNTLLADFRPSYKEFDSKGNEVPIAEAPIVKALSGQKTIDVERMLVRKDGTIRWQSAIATPICNAKQEIIAGYLVLIDTTARKQAEVALRESEQRLLFVLQGSQMGFWDWNLKTNEVVRDERWAEMLGYHLADIEFSVKQWIDFVHPDDRAMAMQSIQDHLEGRTPMHKLEYRMGTKDGHYKWILDQAQVVAWDADQKPARMSGTHTDITERKQAEQILKESESRQRAIIENEPECIKIVDAQGRLTLMNPSGLVMIEADSLEQVAGRPVIDLIAPEHRKAFVEMSQRVLCGESAQMEFEIIGLKGGRHWMETHAVPIQESGQTAQLAIMRDITERKQAECALQQQTDALARSNAELEQFAYLISHDLRQPLRMVNSYIQMLERRLADRLDDDTRGMMHFAVDGAKRMDQMLVSLLEYSRVGRKGEPLAPLSSRDGVDEALRFLAPVIREANATVRVSGDWPNVVASRDEFTRLWQNLIGNAVKYRALDREPEIDITVTPDADGWRFCVADNGIGIAPAQFDRLFKVFQRLVTRDQYEGTGIGLAVARKIVERHGGRIWVKSAGAGQGCRFCFSLPALQAKNKALDLPTEAAA